MTPEQLADWCADYDNTYFIYFMGQINDTGSCPFLRGTISDIVRHSKEIVDISEQASSIDPYFDNEVRGNDAKLYKAKGGEYDIAILYNPE